MRKIVRIILVFLLICIASFVNFFMRSYMTSIANDSVATLDVSIIENGKEITHNGKEIAYDGNWEQKEGVLFTTWENNQDIVLGKKYQEEIAVKNIGTIPFYARITIYKGIGETGGILPSDSVKLHLTDSNWILDEEATTNARMVLYYSKPVLPNETTQNVMDYIMIDPTSIVDDVQFNVQSEQDNRIITSKYKYQGKEIYMKVTVDATGTHDTETAIRSDWGRRSKIDENGNLTLL